MDRLTPKPDESGLLSDEELASKAYNEKAIELFGDFANPNDLEGIE